MLRSLNPYYTGIHLHEGNGAAGYKTGRVLILIILYYMFITKPLTCATLPNIANEEEQQFYVLILIILEYIYIALATLKELNVCVS